MVAREITRERLFLGNKKLRRNAFTRISQLFQISLFYVYFTSPIFLLNDENDIWLEALNHWSTGWMSCREQGASFEAHPTRGYARPPYSVRWDLRGAYFENRCHLWAVFNNNRVVITDFRPSPGRVPTSSLNVYWIKAAEIWAMKLLTWPNRRVTLDLTLWTITTRKCLFDLQRRFHTFAFVHFPMYIIEIDSEKNAPLFTPINPFRDIDYYCLALPR